MAVFQGLGAEDAYLDPEQGAHERQGSWESSRRIVLRYCDLDKFGGLQSWVTCGCMLRLRGTNHYCAFWAEEVLYYQKSRVRYGRASRP